MRILRQLQKSSKSNSSAEFSAKWAWLKIFRPMSSLAPKYRGPYKIFAVKFPVVTIDKDGSSYTVNVDHLKPAWEPIELKDGTSQISDVLSSQSEDECAEPIENNRAGRVSTYGRAYVQTNPYQAGFN